DRQRRADAADGERRSAAGDAQERVGGPEGPLRTGRRRHAAQCGPYQEIRWALIAATTMRWSSTWGRPDTTTAPTGPTSRIRIGKAPPWAAYSAGSRPNSASNVVPRSMLACRT